MATKNFISTERFTLFLIWLFKEMPRANPGIRELPAEIRRHITAYVAINRGRKRKRGSSLLRTSPALTPPANGVCPFMGLPNELRRQIFADALPGRDVLYHPQCSPNHAITHASTNDEKKVAPRKNRVSDLMVLSPKIAEEIAEVMYEERFFVIHVHEGLVHGGVEFLNSGRQFLQYMNLDMPEDDRFVKFGRDKFSFRRLKKIIVKIYPTTEDQSRHTAVNTYFIIKALCHLLDRSGEKKNRITRLEVEFPKLVGSTQDATGRRAIQKEQYWWDPDTKQPRSTSIHQLSNIELVVRQFEMLPCHSVNIHLPENVRHHKPTLSFVSRLEQTMASTDSMMRFADDDLEMKLEVLRKEMEDYVTYTVHGKGYHEIVDLGDTEMNEEENEDEGDDEGAKWHSNLPMRPGQTLRQRKSEQRAILESLQAAQAEEARLLDEAIAASMSDSSPNASSDVQILHGNPYSAGPRFETS